MAENIGRIMAKHGIRPDRRLGQNFLSDETILNSIVEDAQIQSGDTVLEIGPGLGTLTRALAKKAGAVVAVELDRQLIPALREALAGCANTQIINADFMTIDTQQLQKMLGEGFKVVANLPYYITTPILMRILESGLDYTSITVLVQREVALRMAAAPGTADYGALSIAVQYRTAPSLLTSVLAGAFTPPPKVESQVVRLDRLIEPPVKVLCEATFFKVARAAFAMRRKTMANNLMAAFGLAREAAQNALEACNIPQNARGEQLSMAQLGSLSDCINRLPK